MSRFLQLRRGVSFWILAGILLTVLSGCSALLPTEQEVLAPPLVEPPRPRFNLYTVGRGDISDQYMGGGIFVPIQEINLSFGNNSGRLLEVHVRSGDWVEEGDLLAKLNVEELEFNLSQMEIDLRKTRLNMDKMNIDYNKLVSDIRDLRKQIDMEEDAHAKAEQENRLADLNRQRAKFDIDLEIQRLNLRQQERSFNRTRDRVREAELRAPRDGVINFSNRLVIGDWINSYQTIFTLVDPSKLFLRAQPPLLHRFQLGMEMEVTIQGEVFTGIVVMAPSATNEEITDERFLNAVVIDVPDLPDTVKPGDNATTLFIFERREDVLMVPRAGLRTYGNRNFVVVREDDVNRERDVEKGMETSTMVEILLGIEEGEQIILR